MQINKYFLSAITSFFIWGFFGLALKPLHDYSSLDILFYRVFYATFLLLLINFVIRKKIVKNDFQVFKQLPLKQKYETINLTILGGFLLIANWFLFMYAVNHVSLKSASFAYLICPIITTVLAFFILDEKLGKWQWISIIVFVISCGILSVGDLRGLIFSLIIAFSFGSYLVSQRRNNQFDKFVILTVQLVIASIVIIPFFPFYSENIPTEPKFYILMIVIVILFTIIPLFLNLFALKGMTSSSVGILMYINPLINFFLALFYFNEPINIPQTISYGLILMAIIMFNQKVLFSNFYKNKENF